MAEKIVLSGSGTWSIPAGWNDADNTIELIGAGGNGAAGGASASGGGGGGGAYVKVVNVPLKAQNAIGSITSFGYSTTNAAGSIFFLQGYQTTDSDGDPIFGQIFTSISGTSASGITGGVGGAVNTSQFLGGRNWYVDNPPSGRAGGAGGNGRLATSS
jgi:hypothetical protein